MRKQTKLVAALSVTALLAVGASMTSFADTRNPWVDLGDGDWAYVGSDGERVTSEWRRNNNDYFFLDENGVVAKSRLITPDDGDGDAYYYVSGTGARLKNQWVRVINEDQESVNDQTPEVFWYYLRENGKAVRADESEIFKKMAIDYNGSKKTFFFDAEGRMVTGWIEDENDKDNAKYYCDPYGDGSAVTGWQELEVPEDWNPSGDKEYDYIEWFYFDGKGKMKRGEPGKPAVWYNNGWYYSFDENGVLLSDWYNVSATGTSNNFDVATNYNLKAFTTAYGTKGTGWVYADTEDDGEYNWYYLVAAKDANGTVRNLPFNSIANDDTMRAKTINGKIYLFNDDGVMQSGVKTIGNLPEDRLGGAVSRKMVAGTYYFLDSGSTKGQMMTGKQTVEEDGENYTYYFDKKTGAARKNEVVDGVIYGSDGRRIEAENGNSYDIVELDEAVTFKNETIAKGSKVIVSSTGKLRTSTAGYVKVDGVQYKVTKNGTAWDVEEKEEK